MQRYIETIRKATEQCFNVVPAERKPFFLSEKKITSLNSKVKDILGQFFDYLDVKTYPDDFPGELPDNGIRKRDYERAKQLIKDIAQGKSNIVILEEPELWEDEELYKEFRDEMLCDLIILLSKPLTREILFALSEQPTQIPIHGQSWDKGSEQCPDDNSVYINDQQIGTILAQTEDNNFYLSPKPRFVTLAHELIHTYHYCIYGKELMDQLKSSNNNESIYTNPIERYAIEGKSIDIPTYKFPDLAFNERNVLASYQLPERISHWGADLNPGKSIEHYLRKEIPKNYQLLYVAAAAGALENLNYYFNTGGVVDENTASSLLNYMIVNGGCWNQKKEEIFSLFFSKGADLHWVNENGNSMLTAATIRGDVTSVRQLIKAGAKFDEFNILEMYRLIYNRSLF